LTVDEPNIRRQLVTPGDLGELLLAACANGKADRVAGLFQMTGDEAAWNAACAHELESHIAHKLLLRLGSLAVPDRWKAAHDRVALRIGVYMRLLDEIAAALDARGIPILALKNAGIARGIYPCLGCSPMGDIDVLVRKAEFTAAHAVILDLGYTCGTRSVYDAGDALAGGFEYKRETSEAGDLWLELQWRAVAGRWIQPSQEPDADELLARSVPIAGTAVRLLSPEDNLLQVCLHTAKHSYLRAPGLRLHTDVERIVRGTNIDWDCFVGNVRRLRVSTAVYFSLWLPALLIGTPVPAEVLRQLQPPGWKRRRILNILIGAGLFYPHAGRKFTRTGYLLLNSLNYDDLASIREAAFPDRRAMLKQYGPSSFFSLPLQHMRRLADLCFRRTGI
jgi:hypothetical protein